MSLLEKVYSKVYQKWYVICKIFSTFFAVLKIYKLTNIQILLKVSHYQQKTLCVCKVTNYFTYLFGNSLSLIFQAPAKPQKFEIFPSICNTKSKLRLKLNSTTNHDYIVILRKQPQSNIHHCNDLKTYLHKIFMLNAYLEKAFVKYLENSFI